MISPEALLPALLLAHLVGDFLLQPGAWVDERYRLGFRSPRLWLHALIHGALAAIVLCASLPGSGHGAAAVLGGGLAVAVSHWLIDWGKSRLSRRRLRWFLLDQALHLLVLLALWLVWIGSWQPLCAALHWLVTPRALGIGVAYLLVSRPLSIAIALVLRRWSDQLEDPGTLAEAGARIGLLERFLVLTLVLLDQLAAVGFLLTAKSVLRFGDLREAQDRKLTEYVLLGTLLSVSTTLALGLVIRLLLEG